MRARLLTTACFYILVASVGSPAQDEFTGRTDAYSICILKIRHAPQRTHLPGTYGLHETRQGTGNTIMVRVFGDGSLRPASSITVKVATNVPAVE